MRASNSRASRRCSASRTSRRATSTCKTGDAEGVKGRKQFVHIPDLGAEKAARRRHKAEVTAASRSSSATASCSWRRRRSRADTDCRRPRPFCASAQGGFLVAWALPDAPYARPSNGGGRLGTSLGSRVARPHASEPHEHQSRGRFLAVDPSSARNGQTELFDVRDWRVVAGVAMPHVMFADDGSLLICRSQTSLQLVPADGLTGARTREDRGGGASAAVIRTVAGWWPTSGTAMHLNVALVDLNEMRLVRVLATTRHDLGAWMAEVRTGNRVSGFGPGRRSRPRLVSSPDGRLLVVGVDDGVGILALGRRSRDARGLASLRLVRRRTSGLVHLRSSRMRRTYGFAWDGPRGRVLSPPSTATSTRSTSAAPARPGHDPGNARHSPAVARVAVAHDGATLALVVPRPASSSEAEDSPGLAGSGTWTFWIPDGSKPPPGERRARPGHEVPANDVRTDLHLALPYPPAAVEGTIGTSEMRRPSRAARYRISTMSIRTRAW